MNILQSLMELMDASPVNFLAASYVEQQLHAAGFNELKAEEPFPEMKAGDQYYVTKNGSAVFASEWDDDPQPKQDSNSSVLTATRPDSV